MQAGELAVGAIPEWRVSVTVDNVVRAVESVEWDRELSSDLPDAVGGVSGISACTGTIRWAPQQAVGSRPGSPWSRVGAWPPSPGQIVRISVGDDTTAWRVFTGVIESTSGDAESLSSRIIDMSDRLDRPVTLPPVARRMPGFYTEGGASAAYVTTYVQPWYAAYRALREGGWAVGTPGFAGQTIAAADFQGTLSPITGGISFGTSTPTLGWGDGFTYLSAGSVSYEPVSHDPVWASGGVRLWMRWATTGDRRAGATIRFSNDDAVQIVAVQSVDGTASVNLKAWTGGADIGTIVAESTTTIQIGEEDGTVWLELYIRPGGGTIQYVASSVALTPEDTYGTAYKTMTLGETFAAGQTVSSVGVAGTLVAFRAGVLSPTEWRSIRAYSYGRRVRAWGSGFALTQNISRAVENRSARDLLREIGAATLTAIWIDETGIMQWAPSNRLYSQSPVARVTTAQDIFALGWEETSDATRHAVNVTYSEVAVTQKHGYYVTLYQPSHVSTISPGDDNAEFISVPADEEWIDVDMSMPRAQDAIAAFNRGEGSFYGAVAETSPDVYHWSGEITKTLERLGQRSWLLKQEVATGDRDLMSHPDDAALKRGRRGVPLPILRGQGRIVLTDAAVTGASTGPSWAADLTHDMAHWGKVEDATRVANWLSERLSTPLITLTGLEIGYDPRIQLGDVITVDSEKLLGFVADVLIVGKRESHGPDGSRLVLTVRVVRTRTVHTTYEAFEAAYAGNAYQGLEAAWAASDYAALEAAF